MFDGVPSGSRSAERLDPGHSFRPNVAFSCRHACLPVFTHCTFTDLSLKGQKCKRDGQLQRLVGPLPSANQQHHRQTGEWAAPFYGVAAGGKPEKTNLYACAAPS